MKTLHQIRATHFMPGDVVYWSGAWGRQPEHIARITEIVDEQTGEIMQNVKCSELTGSGRRYTVSLDNGHWAYGFQISKYTN